LSQHPPLGLRTSEASTRPPRLYWSAPLAGTNADPIRARNLA